jgi:Probable Zinc-ribbon domain
MAHPARSRPHLRKKMTVEHPDIAAQWDHDANAMHPDDLTMGSETRVGWVCPKGHRWQASPAARVYRGNTCPECSPRAMRGTAPRRALPATPAPGESLAEVNPVLAAQWAVDLNPVTPADVRPKSPYVAWWVCAKCKETREAKVTSATPLCPACSPAVDPVLCPDCGTFREHTIDKAGRHLWHCDTCVRQRRIRAREGADALRHLRDIGTPIPEMAKAFGATVTAVKTWLRVRKVPQKVVPSIDIAAGMARTYLRDNPKPDADTWRAYWRDEVVIQLPRKNAFRATTHVVDDGHATNG